MSDEATSEVTEPQVDPAEDSAEPQVDTAEDSAEPQVDTTEDSAEPQEDIAEDSAEPQEDIAEDSAEPQVDTAEDSAEPQVDTAEDSAEPQVDTAEDSAEPQVDTAEDSPEQQVDTAEEKQSKPDLPDSKLDDDVPDEPTPCSSTNVLTDGLKQPFPDVVDSDEKKNNKSTEVSEDELEIIDKEQRGTPEDISSIKSAIKQLAKESYPEILNLLSSKNVTFDEFDSVCTQKVDEMIKKKRDESDDHSKLQLLKETENKWASAYVYLKRKYKDMKNDVNVHKQALRTNENAQVTSTVGLQAVLCPKKEGSMKSPKQAIPLSKPNPVNIIVEDDDNDVAELGTVESASSSTSKIANTTTKKNGNAKKAKVELSYDPSSSTSVIMKTASRSPQQTIVSNEDTINTSQDPISTDVSQISGTLQPMSTASYTPGQITVSQLSASLKTLTTSYTTCQLPVPRISGSMSGIALPHATPGKSFTTCQLPILRSILLSKKSPPSAIPFSEHPSPVPGIPNQISLPTWKRLPPAPILSITSLEVHNAPQGALKLSWTMNVNKTFAKVIKYEIYVYQEQPNQPPNIDLWNKVGDVDALPLPMSCTLSHISNGQKHHFIVRAVDVYIRVGPFSSPKSII